MKRDTRLARTVRIDLGPTPDVVHDLSKTTRLDFDDVPAAAGESVVREPAPEFRRLLQCIYDAVLITDLDGHVADFNHRVPALFECASDAVQGMHISDFAFGVDAALIESILEDLTPERYVLLDATCIRADGSQFPAEIAVNHLELLGRDHLSFFVRDLTERRRTQDALEEAVTRLEAHDQARSKFVSNVSHELRTPLTSMIYAITNILRGVVGPISDSVQEYLAMLEGDTKRLLSTVNDILDLRKLESGTLSLDRSSLRLSSLVERTVASLQGQAQRKGSELAVQTLAAGGFVDGDFQKLERVILNLVGNAIKFSESGGHIVVAASVSDDDDKVISMTVTDDGPGIDAEELPRVTERYYTVGSQPSGSGMGLSISKEIVELHGGALTIISPPVGQSSGTQIRVALKRCSAPLVLLAGDQTTLKAPRSVLEAYGYEVATTQTNDDTQRLLAEGTPKLLLLDVDAPSLDVRQLLLTIRAEHRPTALPILALCERPIRADEQQILEACGVSVIAVDSDGKDAIDLIEGALFDSDLG